MHRPPRAPLVDRVEFITSYVTSRSVIDLGFVDESRMLSKQAIGTWLHARVAKDAVTAVGIDSDPVGVNLARELGYDAHAADCEDREELAGLGLQPADVVVAGELIEHLDQPGRFLEAVKVLVKQARDATDHNAQCPVDDQLPRQPHATRAREPGPRELVVVAHVEDTAWTSWLDNPRRRLLRFPKGPDARVCATRRPHDGARVQLIPARLEASIPLAPDSRGRDHRSRESRHPDGLRPQVRRFCS